LNSQITYFGCDECTFGFKSVWWSTLTLFKELIAGDAWIVSFPLFEKNAAIAPLMVLIVVTITLGIMNLILTVIVECAASARDKDIQDRIRQKNADRLSTKKELLEICMSIDVDDNGRISCEELLDAYNDSDKFKELMMILEVTQHDMTSIFKILDTDCSGELSYEEFCEELVNLKSADQLTLLALTRLNVKEVSMQVERSMESTVAKIWESVQVNDSQLQDITKKLDQHLLSLAASCTEQATTPQMLVTGFPKMWEPVQGNEAQINDITNELNQLSTTLAAGRSEQPATPQMLAIDSHTWRALDTLDQKVRRITELGDRVAREVEGQVATHVCHSELLGSLKKDVAKESGEDLRKIANGMSEQLGQDQYFRAAVQNMEQNLEQLTALWQHASNKVTGVKVLLERNRAQLNQMRGVLKSVGKDSSVADAEQSVWDEDFPTSNL